MLLRLSLARWTGQLGQLGQRFACSQPARPRRRAALFNVPLVSPSSSPRVTSLCGPCAGMDFQRGQLHCNVARLAAISANDFNRIADELLEKLSEEIDLLVDKHPDGREFDFNLSSGVLTLSLGRRGTFVINRQTPNLQIWLSSPISGPKRYDWLDGNWRYKYDNVTLHDRLRTELSSLLGCPVEISDPGGNPG